MKEKQGIQPRRRGFINPLLLGFLGFFNVLQISCENPAQSTHKEVMLAKTVPGVFQSLNQKGWKFHQDTLYFKEALFTGFIFDLSPKGDTLILNGYFNGLKEGVQKMKYPNGQWAEIRNYINGKKEGEQKGWWPNGKLKFLFFTENDAYTGEFKEWDSSGFLYKDFHYMKGQEEGHEQLWWGNHSLRSNYQVINSKRYGLLGIKICKNPYDSINKK